MNFHEIAPVFSKRIVMSGSRLVRSSVSGVIPGVERTIGGFPAGVDSTVMAAFGGSDVTTTVWRDPLATVAQADEAIPKANAATPQRLRTPTPEQKAQTRSHQAHYRSTCRMTSPRRRLSSGSGRAAARGSIPQAADRR